MRRLKAILKYALVLFFVLAGLNHFLHTDFYVRIMPPYLPWHRFLVYFSGALEIALGVGLLIPRLTNLSAWGLIALLMAVFPANIHMALHSDLFPEFNPAMLWLRLPLQLVLIAWAYWYILPFDSSRSGRL
ncbi:MAG: DoxX family protein [Nitrospiraceae bacterium]